MEKELISVIVSVYNIKDYLPKCFETITRQTYQNLEIILVDDGSTDGSDGLCDELAETDPRVKAIHQSNQGLWAARNAGKRKANGEYLMFIDGDDYIHRETISFLLEAINASPDFEIAFCDCKETTNLNEDTIGEVDKPVLTELTRDDMIEGILANRGNRVFYVWQWNKLYRSRLIENVWCREYMKSQDFDFNFRTYLITNKAVWVHFPMYYYVQREGSLCHRPDSYKIYYRLRTNMLWRNYVELPPYGIKYRHSILKDLYYFMDMYIKDSWNTEERDVVSAECRRYEQSVRYDYLLDGAFPFKERIKNTIGIQLTRWPRVLMATKRLWGSIYKILN